MDALAWFLLIVLHGSGSGSPGTCCASMAEIRIPSIEISSCKKTATETCKASPVEICMAIAEENKNTTTFPPLDCVAQKP